jgi:beta-N-acetylhexosaminidase
MKYRFFWFLLVLLRAGGTIQGEAPSPAAAAPAETLLRRRAASLAASLDDRLLAAQVLMTGIDGRRHLGDAMKALLEDCPAGALMLFKYNLDTEKEGVRSLLDECAALAARESGIPPFIAVDHEGGPVHRFGPGVTRLPAAASWQILAEKEGPKAALAALEEASFRSAKEIGELGVNLNLAPVAECLGGGNRIFLGDRSFGPDPEFTAAAAAAFIRGMERGGIGCVVKHFPGNTEVDPHRAVPVLSGDRETLRELVKPFRILLETQRPGALMAAHTLVPAWDGENTASLSPKIIGEWLRRDLGFEGIIVADDFSMAAAASLPGPGAAAVRALSAGADMVMCWPMNIGEVHAAVLAALDGGLSRKRLREAAERIIFEKLRLGIIPADW